jgi:hypothetical protein
MNRLERLQSYKRMQGPKGPGRDERNLAYWANRASENSDSHLHRAKGDAATNGVPTRDLDLPKLPSTAEHPAKARYWPNEGPKMRKAAKADRNHVASDDNYLPNVRRSRE